MIKVSVIMPVYNAETYLAETLDCLVRQTLNEIEVICIDDGSRDASYRILDKYRRLDARIRVLSQENAGAGAARNLGIQYASGEYLSILDADDRFEPDMLEASYHKAKKYQADICVFKMDKFTEETGCRESCHWSLSKWQLPDFEPFTYRDLSENLFKVFVGWTWDKLFRRTFILDHALVFQKLRTSNDLFFTFAALVKAEKICILSRTLVHQRIGLEDSLSATRERSWSCFYQALLALRSELAAMGIYEEVERSYINYALHFSLWNLNTLRSPTFETLYERLRDEYFAQLDICNRDRDYFWNQEEYRQYEQVLTLTPQEYRIANGMEPACAAVSYQGRPMRRCENPKVSLLLPVCHAHPVEQILTACLNQAVNQTMDDMELICILIGANSNSLDIIRKFAAEDKRIVVLDGSADRYGKAVSRGLAAARGTFVSIVEPRDDIRLDMCEVLYETAQKQAVDFVRAGCSNCGSAAGGKFCGRVLSPDGHPAMLQFVRHTWGGLYRRSFLDKNQIRFFASSGPGGQNHGFWFQTYCFAERMYFLEEEFYQKRLDIPVMHTGGRQEMDELCGEYRDIYAFLMERPGFMERFLGYYQLKRYDAYGAFLDRIADEWKWEFTDRMHEEFQASMEKGELPEEVFGDLEWDEVRELAAHPMDFYAHRYAKRYQGQIACLEQEKARIEQENMRAEQETLRLEQEKDQVEQKKTQAEWENLQMRQQILQIRQENKNLKQEITQIKDSRTWKAGRMIAFIPQKILSRKG